MQFTSQAVVLALLALLSSAQIVCTASHFSGQSFQQLKSGADCSVEDFGVVGNGKSYDTLPMQAAIDACFESGGGRLVIPSGMKILTGTLWLKSNIELHLEEEAVIVGGTQREDYHPSERELWYVIAARNASNVSITGPGEINGQAHSFVLEYREEKNVMLSWNRRSDNCNEEDQEQCRPRLVGFIDCANVTVKDVHLTEPAFWCLHIVRCDTTTVRNVTIYGDFNIPNNDAIDVDGSNNTVVEGCHISTGDDGVCAKTKAGPTFNLSASNCWIRSKSSAVKIGSEVRYDMANLSFVNMTIVASHRGIAIQARDAGNVSDVSFVNVSISTRYYDPSWWGRAEPIYITSVPRRETTVRGALRNVTVTNVTARSENGIVIAGCPGHEIEQLRLENISIEIGKWSQYPGGLLDYRPGYRGLVPHRTVGVFAEHVAQLGFKSVRIEWGSQPQLDWGMLIDMTPGTVKEVTFDGFSSSQPSAYEKHRETRGDSGIISLFQTS